MKLDSSASSLFVKMLHLALAVSAQEKPETSRDRERHYTPANDPADGHVALSWPFDDYRLKAGRILLRLKVAGAAEAA